MHTQGLPDVDVLIVRDERVEGTYTIMVFVPGFPPITRYDVPLLSIIETLELMRKETLQ